MMTNKPSPFYHERFDWLNFFFLPQGASVIRMLRDFLGSEGFTSGLQLYLKKFAYGNAVTDDLWACMSQVR